jgi:hypothetical protein
MKPVYFPYTYVSPSVARALRAYFPSVAVYQPVAGRLPDEMRPLAQDGFLEVISPPPGDEEDFDRFIRDLQQWGRLHQGGAGLMAAILHGRSPSEPISGDGSPAAIASEIRSGMRRRLAPERAPQDGKAILRSRLVLHLAQAADQQDLQIADGLADYEQARGRLFDSLTGREDPAESEFGLRGGTDPFGSAEDRLDLRMDAWARLFSIYPYPSPVFVTHARAVIRHLAENVPGRLRVGFTGLPQALQKLAGEMRPPARDLMSQLAALAAAPLAPSMVPNDDTEESTGRDRADEPCLHLWPGIPPLRFFNSDPAAGPMESNPAPFQSTWRNTLVVQIR